MSQKCEEATTKLVVPHFDFVVITTRYNQWLNTMEINTANWAIVLVESLEQYTHATA
jgi:hypothetical protein